MMIKELAAKSQQVIFQRRIQTASESVFLCFCVNARAHARTHASTHTFDFITKDLYESFVSGVTMILVGLFIFFINSVSVLSYSFCECVEQRAHLDVYDVMPCLGYTKWIVMCHQFGMVYNWKIERAWDLVSRRWRERERETCLKSKHLLRNRFKWRRK